MNDSKLLQFKFNEGVVYFRFFIWAVLLILLLISFLLNYDKNSAPITLLLLFVFVLIKWIANFRYFLAVFKKIPAFELKNGFVIDFQNGVEVDWADVESYGLVEGYLSTYVELKVKNKKKYLKLIKNPVAIAQNLLSMNKEIIVFSVDTSFLETSGKYFISEIEKFDFSLNKQPS